MTLYDKNQTLLPPAGYLFTRLRAEGSFLRVEYRRIDSENVSVVTIYLNDMGREVVRSVDEEDLDLEIFPEPQFLSKKHLTRWSRFKLWLSLSIYGIREMICRN